MKKLLVFIILLILIVSCEKQAPQEPPKEEPQEKLREEKVQLPNITLRQHGFEVNITGPELQLFAGKDSFIFNFLSKDLLNRTELRDPKRWNLFIYYLGNQIIPVLRCSSEKLEKNLWSNTYCLEKNTLSEELYHRELFLIYTNNTLSNLEQKTIIRIKPLRTAIVSNFTLNK